MTLTWFEHATFWSGVRRATVAPQGHCVLNTVRHTALVSHCRCECMCKPIKPYSESTVFRPYSFWLYNYALKLPVHVCKLLFLECMCMTIIIDELQWHNRSASGIYTVVSSRAMPRLWVQASPGAIFNFITLYLTIEWGPNTRWTFLLRNSEQCLY